MTSISLPPNAGTEARAWIDLYATTMRIAIAEQFQYRVANYFYMIGMIAEPVVYLVVWTTVANQQGGAVAGITPGEFAAYYIVWTLVRNMNIVFTPFGWEERIREGQFSGQLLRPVHPIHWDLAYFAGWKVVVIILWLPIAAVLSLLFHPTAAHHAARRHRVLHRDLGRLPDPLAQPVGARHGHVLDDPRRADVQLYFAAELLLSGRLVPLQLHARRGSAAGRDPAVPVDVRFPIEALIGDLPPERAARRPGDAGAAGSSIGAIARPAVVRRSRSGATRAVGG